MKRFHNRVYFEPGASKEIKDIIQTFKRITKSKHFMERARISYIPTIMELLNSEIFEYYRDTGNKQIEKFCVRVRKANCDFIYIINKFGNIVTGWANKKDDIHRTLDLSVYERGV